MNDNLAIDSNFMIATKLFRDGRKFALLDQTVDSIDCLIKALALLDPLKGTEHRVLRSETLFQIGMVEIWRGRYGTAHDMLDEAVKLDPTKALFWAFLSQAQRGLHACDKALESAIKAKDIDGKSSIIWHLLAETYTAKGMKIEAIECYRQAGEVCPETAEAYFMLGNCMYVAGQKEDAGKWYKKAINLDPENPDANYGYSVYLTEKFRFREALPYIEKGMKSQASGHAAHWSKSLAHLILGEYEQGWKDFECRQVFMEQQYGHYLANRRFDKPQWSPKLDNGTVHIYSEQGFGDALQYVRYVKLFDNELNKIILEVDRSMVDLMQHNFGFANVIPMSDSYPDIIGIPACDSRISLGSMPYAFGTTLETIPLSSGYLTAQPEYIEKWAHIRNHDGLKVGLCWAGGKRVQDKNLSEMDARRSINFDTVRPLLEQSGAKFFSLQTGLAAREADGSGIIDHMADCKSWSDTAGIISNLDLVISVDTSVIHLAGAMGKSAFLINKYATCWRWLLDREDSPWYKSIKIFRHPSDVENWDHVIDNIREELNDLA